MSNKKFELAGKLVFDAYNSPWIFQKLSISKLTYFKHLMSNDLIFWMHNSHQNKKVSLARAQRKHTILVIDNYIYNLSN